MPVYIVTSSNESLTIADKKKSLSLITKLDEFTIDHVFCSPSLFCLQSILPYCWKYGIYARIEYSLHDFVDEICVVSKDSRQALCMLNGYKSITKVEELESEDNVCRKKRVTYFYEYVKQMFSPTSTVLLFTHQNCSNTILETNTHCSKTIIDDFNIIYLE
jgi:hypothetical protein